MLHNVFVLFVSKSLLESHGMSKMSIYISVEITLYLLTLSMVDIRYN